MTTVFIVRPFGEKPVQIKSKTGKLASVKVNFDDIDRLLIQPALKKNALKGDTTGVIAEAGNIRVDMFQMLIAYDLVIADMSINNANVFYELGIRHGLRPNGTILIRFESEGDVPFDLKTDRYIPYNRENPSKAIDDLARTIKDTLTAQQSQNRRPDSPVFLLLPKLAPPDAAKLLVVPKEFQEAVAKAESDAQNGRTTLALLAEEAKRTPWAREGVRWVALAQRRIKHFPAALESWEYIRGDLPDDVEANLQLATIYQLQGDLVSASQACQRVLDNPGVDRKWRADARSQLARNEKGLWAGEFAALASEEKRRAQAVSDSRLTDAFEGYMAGFREDLNNYYSGINALGLLTAIVKLAEGEPAAWRGRYPAAKRASDALDEFREQLPYVRGAVRISLDNADRTATSRGQPDEWLPASQAQYALLTEDNPVYVGNAYKKAKIAGKDKFSVDSEARQVGIFSSLGLFPQNCVAALDGLGVPPVAGVPAAAAPPAQNCVIVGTGHRVRPERPQSASIPEHPRVRRESERLAARAHRGRKGGAGGDRGIGDGNRRGGKRVRSAVPRDLRGTGRSNDGGAADPQDRISVSVRRRRRPGMGRTVPEACHGEAADHPKQERRHADLGGVDRQLWRVSAGQHLGDEGRPFPAERQRHAAGAVEREGRRRTRRNARYDRAREDAGRESLRQGRRRAVWAPGLKGKTG